MSVPTVTLSGKALQGVAPHLVPHYLMTQGPQQVRLGRVRPKARPQALRLSSYLKDNYRYTLPQLPIDWASKAAAALAQMYLNNTLGCCVISDAYHQTGVWTANATGQAAIGTDQEVLQTYRIWNPGRQDNGCNIVDVLNYRRDHGIPVGGVLHKIDGYVSVDWTNWDEVLIALYLFGSLTLGINLPQAWTQNDVWDVTNTQIVGGHDVCGVAVMTPDGVDISSWARRYKVTKAAFTSRRWLEETYVVLSPDWYAKANQAPNFISVADLKSDLAKFGGGVIPDIGPSPNPNPDPNPNPNPNPNPTPAPSPLFPPLTFKRQVPKNGLISFRSPAMLPAGSTLACYGPAPADSLGDNNQPPPDEETYTPEPTQDSYEPEVT